jgi:cation diffusion facilitator CzcD-associated flavoprotein CzcO
VLSAVVIGAGQAGLAAAFHLRRLEVVPGREFVVLDANMRPGGAWQHRWSSLTMGAVHGVAALPDLPVPAARDDEQARAVIPPYFAEYERRYQLPVVRPVQVTAVEPVLSTGAASGAGRDLLRVRSADESWLTRTVINATGTWERPFIPYYPGMGSFAGRKLHTHDYAGPAEFRGMHVVVVGGGASAVQILAELSEVATTTWVTRRTPVWRTAAFTESAGREAVALVEERVRRGLPPASVVSVTGLMLREQEQAALARGVYLRRPMFARVTASGVEWADGVREDADAILWCTGFRPDVIHLAPLGLRSPLGGIELDGTSAVADRRVQLVGYGPSASTIGASRAGRTAALNVSLLLAGVAHAAESGSDLS